jgi:hypothetical protein
MKKKTGGVEPGYQKICLSENQEVQIVRCFGIFEKSYDCTKYLSGRINHVIQHVIVGGFLSLPTMFLCSTKKQKMDL